MAGALFLAGGGTSEQSFAIDRLFVQRCRASGPLVYVPTALRSQSSEASLAWFRSAMLAHRALNIAMWEDLEPRLSVDQIGGLYIGGGDTAFLLQEMCRTGFDTYVRNAWAAGVPIYGGSAGAIVLGASLGGLRAATEAGHSQTEGLGLVFGYVIACHYRESDMDRLQSASASLGAPMIAIPETGGVVVEAGGLLSIGPDPVAILDGIGACFVPAGESVRLREQSSFSRGT